MSWLKMTQQVGIVAFNPRNPGLLGSCDKL